MMDLEGKRILHSQPLQTENAPTLPETVKTELCYRNDTIIIFSSQVIKNKDNTKLYTSSNG